MASESDRRIAQQRARVLERQLSHLAAALEDDHQWKAAAAKLERLYFELLGVADKGRGGGGKTSPMFAIGLPVILVALEEAAEQWPSPGPGASSSAAKGELDRARQRVARATLERMRECLGPERKRKPDDVLLDQISGVLGAVKFRGFWRKVVLPWDQVALLLESAGLGTHDRDTVRRYADRFRRVDGLRDAQSRLDAQMAAMDKALVAVRPPSGAEEIAVGLCGTCHGGPLTCGCQKKADNGLS